MLVPKPELNPLPDLLPPVPSSMPQPAPLPSATLGNVRTVSSVLSQPKIEKSSGPVGATYDMLDVHVIQDISHGLVRRLSEFERAVRRLDGGQDSATDYANARFALASGVDESIDTIDDACEMGVPCANLIQEVEKSRAALDNVRDNLEKLVPLPVIERVNGADNELLAVLTASSAVKFEDKVDDIESVVTDAREIRSPTCPTRCIRIWKYGLAPSRS